MKCNGCNGTAIKNPNKDDYSHYDYFCPKCETYLFERHVTKEKYYIGEGVREVVDNPEALLDVINKVK